MIRRCCQCKKILGEKEPLEDKSFTDTYCKECANEVYAQIEQMKKEK